MFSMDQTLQNEFNNTEQQMHDFFDRVKNIAKSKNTNVKPNVPEKEFTMLSHINEDWIKHQDFETIVKCHKLNLEIQAETSRVKDILRDAIVEKSFNLAKELKEVQKDIDPNTSVLIESILEK